MYIVPIAWLYVTVMMAVAEATNTTGTVLGGLITFLLYGLLPVALVLYLMGAPLRRRAIKAQELSELEAAQAVLIGEPNACGKAASDTVAAERKEA
jgi:membrane protein implicated in regulation of membrane protease activity